MFEDYWRIQWKIAIADDRECALLGRQQELRAAINGAEGVPV